MSTGCTEQNGLGHYGMSGQVRNFMGCRWWFAVAANSPVELYHALSSLAHIS